MIFLLLLASLVAYDANADDYFTSTRSDRSVPVHCSNLSLKVFSLQYRTILYGVADSTGRGFTHAVPISREDAGFLWRVLADGRQNDSRVRSQIKRKRLESFLGPLLRAKTERGFRFDKEGDVLEVLAIAELEKEYPAPEFFITGGVAYHEEGTPAEPLGELDIVISERSGCRVIAVGETKLGIDEAGYAGEQLKRFHSFLSQKCKSTDECG